MKKRHMICFSVLIMLLIFLMGLNISLGSVKIPVSEIFDIITGKSNNISFVNIVKEIRFPRIMASIILGGALSVSGFLLQTFFANPIAGPFVLGISSGAKLTVALAMIFFLQRGMILNSASMIAVSFIGSMISMGFILLISGRVKKSSMLVVSGIMIGYICSSVTDFIVTFADDSNIVSLHNWSMGSFSGIDNKDVKVMSIVILTAVVFTFVISKQIGAYQLGEVYAQNLGVNIKLFRLMLIILSSILSASVTAFAGPVSFVGIAVPHLIKNFFGTSKPAIVIPASFFGGASFCLLCDLIARMIFAPTELSISSVTAVLGAPVVIFIMLKNSKSKQR